MAKQEKPTVKRKVIVNARVSADDLEELDRIGREAKPAPASRSEMIAAAVREYVERHRGRAK
jgi:metal-responsive CopG/Arc/MetJ family transcriptional regulator